MKSPEELAYDYGEKFDNVEISKNDFFIGNNPTAPTKEYATLDTIWSAEDCNRWSVANTDKIFY
jgi:hypothetical protein